MSGYFNKETNATYNFVAPVIEEDENKVTEVVFPTTEIVTPTIDSDAAEVEVKRDTTIVVLGAAALSNETTVTLTPDADLPVGSKVYVKWINGGAKVDITVKKDANTKVRTLVGVNNLTVTKLIIWTGTAWLIVE